ncbi:MAG: hypothetical protein ACRED5_19780 [Propylenella sp.]
MPMIRLSARPDEGVLGEDAFVYTIRSPGHEPLVTRQAAHVIVLLDALGVESPERLIAQLRQWREIEVHTATM